MIDDEYMKVPMKDKPKPKLKDSGLAKLLEDHLASGSWRRMVSAWAG